MTVDDLADMLKRRGLDRVRYFHVDHFEPWSFNVHEESVRAVERFAEMARASPYARRLSLFYCPFISYHLEPEHGAEIEGDRVPGDRIVFGRRSDRHEKLTSEAMRPLVTEDRHELHLHVHHEFWTRNRSDFDNPISRWVNSCSTREADRNRLDLYFRLCTEAIGREIGTPFARWAFIHGNWALAGSDPLICHIENELGMIMRHGGFGDFSFPAGRGYCDPRIEAPFTCRPIDKIIRAYDDAEADPRPVGAGTRVIAPDRFFIWNSPIKADYSSLDYDETGANRDLFDAPDRVVLEWLGRSVALDRALFVKTHAHSVRWQYKLAEPGTLIPHCRPNVEAAFDLLARACDRAHVELEFVTINEVMDVLSELDSRKNATMEAGNAVRAGAASRPKTPLPGIRRSRLPVLARDLGAALRDWVYADISRREQAGSFYQQRLTAGDYLASYEWAVVDYLLAKFPPNETRVVEVGSGYGLLCMVLAACGYETIGFEGLRARFEGTEFLVAQFEGHFPQLRENLQAVRGWFPDALRGSMTAAGRRNVLVATNIVNTAAAARQDHILRAAVRFDDVIIDPTRFGITRYEPGRAEAFRKEIGRVFTEIAQVWVHEPNEIWHCQPARALNPEIALAGSTPIAGTAGRRAAGLTAQVVQVDTYELNDELVAAQRAWVARPTDTPARDNLYEQKLARETLLEEHEIAVARAIASRFSPAATRIVEIGTGHGAFAILLARRGFPVHGYEGNRARHGGFLWQVADQLRRRPYLEDNLAITQGMFPAAFECGVLDAHATNLCVATNITSTYSAKNQEAILRALVIFDDVIIDLARFGENRDGQQGRNRLLASLMEIYFEPVQRLYFNDPYEYWHLKPRPILAAPSKPEAGAGTVPGAAVPPLGDPNASFPVVGEGGLLYTVHGDLPLAACPVCRSGDTRPLWRMPMTSLSQPISLFGGYFNQVPTLETPSAVYCFDFCRTCESLFLNPVPAAQKERYRAEDHYIADMNGAAAWREYEEAYDGFAKWIPPGAAVMIDAACGLGQYLDLARRRAAHPWRRLVGLELSEKYVADMRGRDIEAHVFDLDSDNLAALMGADRADFVSFCEGFEHVAAPLDVLRKLVAALRPGGRLFFTAQRYGRDVKAAVRPGEPIYIGEKLVRELPERLGCRVVNIATSGMRYYIVLER